MAKWEFVWVEYKAGFGHAFYIFLNCNGLKDVSQIGIMSMAKCKEYVTPVRYDGLA